MIIHSAYDPGTFLSTMIASILLFKSEDDICRMIDKRANHILMASESTSNSLAISFLNSPTVSAAPAKRPIFLY